MNEPLFLLARERDESFRTLKAKLVPTREALQRQCLHSTGRALWVVPRPEFVSWFKSCSPWRARDQRLLVFGRQLGQQHVFLHALFRFVVSESELHLLPREELLTVLAAPNRDQLLVGGAIDPDDEVAVLYRGNLEPVVVPMDWFKVSGDGTRPDPARFEVTDFGQTVKLGEYEAATHAILYDFDKEYRRTAKAKQVEQDKSFGGALRRLRILRGLSQGDFEPNISGKEISRLEKNQVKKPHAETLKILAKRLRVKADDISTY
jgi:hypothetical protein